MGTSGGPKVGVRAEVYSSDHLSLGHSETFLTSDSAIWAPSMEFDFLATTPSTTLRLFDITPSGATGSPLVIDSVTVTTIPEPGVLALASLGLVALALRRPRS